MQNALELSKLALSHYKEAKYQDALKLYLETAKLLHDHFLVLTDNQPELIDSPLGTIFAHTNVSSCYFAIGNCYKNLEEYEQAVPYFYACLAIADKTVANLSIQKIEERIGVTEIFFTEKTPIKSSSQYWINIPQARTGRLISSVDYLKLAGLYTDRFSSCIIVIIKSSSRISMTHLDHMSDSEESFLAHLISEYSWVYNHDENTELTIIHKKIGQLMVDKVKKFFEFVNSNTTHELCNKIKQKAIEVPDKIASVKAGFSKGIECSEITVRPLNLLCHPNDIEITAVRQIETVLYLSNRTEPPITRTIFNGCFWQPLQERELRPYCNTDMVKRFIAEHKAADPFMLTAQKFLTLLATIAQKIPNTLIITPVKDLSAISARYLCLYSTRYDFKKMFCQDLSHILSLYENDSSLNLLENDRMLIKSLMVALKNEGSALVESYRIISGVKEIKSIFQKEIHGAFFDFMKFYIHLQNAARRVNEATRSSEAADKLCKMALQSYLKKDYNAAKNLYLEAFQYLAHAVKNDNLQLIKTCEHLGYCFFHLNEFEQTFRFLNMTISLYTQYLPKDTAAIERIEKILSRYKTSSIDSEVTKQNNI